MSQGRKELRSIRLRLESTPGVASPPRYVWRGNGDTFDDQRELTNVEEQIGVFGGSDRSYIAKLKGDITLAETPATFEQLSIVFAGSGLGSAGGSAHGASGSAVAHYFPLPASTVWPQQTFTIEAGEPAQGLGGEAETGTYGLVKEWTLKGAGGEAITVESTWLTRTIDRARTNGSFSNVGTVPSVETILAGNGTMYLDPIVTGATFGATQIPAGNVLGFELTCTPKWATKFPIDSGLLYFHTAVFTGFDLEGEVTWEHQATGTQSAAGTAGQKDRWRAEEGQLMRMVWRGGTIPLGTGFTSKTLQIDIPIKWKKFDPLDDQDGNSIVTASFFSKFNELVPAVGRGTILMVRRGQQEMLN